MKMPISKPQGRVSDMIKCNQRTKSVFDMNGDVIKFYTTATFIYPDSHPRARYNKQKKLLKAMKAA